MARGLRSNGDGLTTRQLPAPSTGPAPDSAGPAGGVTSVGLSLPSIFAVTGSPVTRSGTLAGALAEQAANTVFAGPVSGGNAAPTFRALVGDDLPLTASPASPASNDTFLRVTIAGVQYDILARQV